MIDRSPKKVSGHAGILFVMIFPVLFGIFVWATDGARMLQTSARLTDAMEVAVLAISAQASEKQDKRVVTGEQFIQSYFPDAIVTVSSASKLPCKDNAECNSDDKRFYEYGLSATIKRDTLFPGTKTSYASYGENFTAGRTSVARKGLSEPVDVVLVADYSGSMWYGWEGGTDQRYKDQNRIMKEIADELEHYNEKLPDDHKSKLALVGFDYYTARYEDGIRYFSHNIYCKENGNLNSSCFRKDKKGKKGKKDDKDKDDEDKDDEGSQGEYQEKFIVKEAKIDIAKTVDQIFNPRPLYLRSWDVMNISNFETLDLTDDFDYIRERVDTFFVPSPKNPKYLYKDWNKKNGRCYKGEKDCSGTASYAGIIRAAQIAESGDNPRRLIIILSDGTDPDQPDLGLQLGRISEALVDAGMCSKIRDHLNNLTTSDGQEVRAEMAVVGFTYAVKEKNHQMNKCVGEDRVYQAENPEEIKDQILSLVAEEVGSLVR